MVTATGSRPSVAFITALDNQGSGTDTIPPDNQHHDPAADPLSTSTSARQLAPDCSESGRSSNSRVESLSRDSRRGRDVKTAEVDLVGYQHLPASVRQSSVVQKVIREAPFAVGASKAIWKVFLASQPFTELTADGFWFVVAHEIVRIPFDAGHSPRFSRMAHAYSYMFSNVPPFFKDMWGSYFFEAWALTLLISLQESFSKNKPLFGKPSFRMRLLDLCAEWTMGIRPSFPLAGHWVLKFDRRPPTELELLKRRTFGAGLSGSSSAPSLSKGGPGDTTGKRETGTPVARRRGGIPAHRLNYVATRSAVEFGNSPFVQHHLRILTGEGKISVPPVRLQLTGEATRTLRPFQEESLRLANDRWVQSNTWRAAQAIRARSERPATADILTRVDERRQHLMQQHVSSRRETRQEISRIRVDAARDRSSIDIEATDLLLNGDVHEFSNFLARHQAKKHRDPGRKVAGVVSVAAVTAAAAGGGNGTPAAAAAGATGGGTGGTRVGSEGEGSGAGAGAEDGGDVGRGGSSARARRETPGAYTARGHGEKPGGVRNSMYSAFRAEK